MKVNQAILLRLIITAGLTILHLPIRAAEAHIPHLPIRAAVLARRQDQVAVQVPAQVLLPVQAEVLAPATQVPADAK